MTTHMDVLEGQTVAYAELTERERAEVAQLRCRTCGRQDIAPDGRFNGWVDNKARKPGGAMQVLCNPCFRKRKNG